MARTSRTCSRILLVALCAASLLAQLPKDAADEFRQALHEFREGRYDSALKSLDSLELRFPGAADIHHLKAIVLDLQGRPEEANRHFKKAVQLNPASPEMGSNYATSLMRLGRREDALAEFRRVLERAPGNPTANFNLATILFDEKRFAEALPHFEKAFSAQPGVYENGYQLALCQFLLEDYPAARRTLAELGPAPEDRLEFHLLEALSDQALGREAEAAARLSNLLPRLAQSPPARRLAIALLLGRELYAEALPLLESAVAEASASSGDWMRLAHARRALADREGAVAAAARASQLAEDAGVHAFLGELLEELGKPLEAVEHFQRAVAIDPSEEHYFALGYEFLSHWNWETAQRVLEAGLQRHHDSWRLRLALGAALLGQNQIESAADAFLKSIDRSPQPLAYQLLALCYDQAGDRRAAVGAAFQRFYRENPEDPKAAYYWAFTQFRDVSGHAGPSDSLASARSILAEAIRRNPDDFEAHYLLGEIDAYRQDWEAAVQSLSEAVLRHPEHVQARYKLGLALRRAGRSEAARRELEEYQRLKQTQDQDVSERVSQTRRFIVELKQP